MVTRPQSSGHGEPHQNGNDADAINRLFSETAETDPALDT